MVLKKVVPIAVGGVIVADWLLFCYHFAFC